VPFPAEKIRDHRAFPEAESVQELLEIYGNGRGCEVLQACSQLHRGRDVLRAARRGPFSALINDRVHANIQKDGTFSVVPACERCDEPDELRRIADVATSTTCQW
jgi:nitrite reductase (NADH) large subunit